MAVPFTVDKLISIGEALSIEILLSFFVTNFKVNTKSSPSVAITLSIITIIASISLQSLSGLSILSAFGKSVGTCPFVGFTKFLFVSKASSSPSLSASILEAVFSGVPSLSRSQPSIRSSRISLSEFISIKSKIVSLSVSIGLIPFGYAVSIPVDETVPFKGL